MSDEDKTGLVLQLDPAGPARLKLPLRVTVQGIEAVLVSAEAFDALSQPAATSVGRRSRIERDAELKAFIDARLTTHEMPTLRQQIIKRFGAERTPSSSALGRYAIARRNAFVRVARQRAVKT